MKFKCWDESNTDEDGAETYEAGNALEAAEACAKDEHDAAGGEATNELEIHVRWPVSHVYAEGRLEVFIVTIDYEPTFRARLKQTESPK